MPWMRGGGGGLLWCCGAATAGKSMWQGWRHVMAIGEVAGMSQAGQVARCSGSRWLCWSCQQDACSQCLMCGPAQACLVQCCGQCCRVAQGCTGGRCCRVAQGCTGPPCQRRRPAPAPEHAAPEREPCLRRWRLQLWPLPCKCGWWLGCRASAGQTLPSFHCKVGQVVVSIDNACRCCWSWRAVPALCQGSCCSQCPCVPVHFQGSAQGVSPELVENQIPVLRIKLVPFIAQLCDQQVGTKERDGVRSCWLQAIERSLPGLRRRTECVEPLVCLLLSCGVCTKQRLQSCPEHFRVCHDIDVNGRYGCLTALFISGYDAAR
jgi:hypothetical protein